METLKIVLIVIAALIVVGLLMALVAKIYDVNVDDFESMSEKSRIIYIILFPLFKIYKLERDFVKWFIGLFKKKES